MFWLTTWILLILLSVVRINQGLDLEVVDVVLVRYVNISDAFVTRESRGEIWGGETRIRFGLLFLIETHEHRYDTGIAFWGMLPGSYIMER